MTRSIFLSLVFHSAMVVITALTLPFMKRAPIDLPPILSVDLIQITDKTSIPFAAKAAKTLEKITNIFFGSKRKMVNKAFAKIFNEYKLVAKKLKINLSARPSELSFEDYYRLVEYYEKFK